jgi:hypothetical protein
LAVSLTLAVAACAGGRPPDLVLALKRASVADVVVEVPPGIYDQFFAVDLAGVSDKDKAPAVAATVRKSLIANVMGKPGGSEKARLRVTLTGLWVGSSAGRVLGTGSRLSGSVRLESLGTGELIANLGTIEATDAAVRGSGNIGLVIALAANVVTAASQDRIETISNAFAENVQTALKPE